MSAPELASLQSVVGKEFGPSRWVEVTQDTVDAFAAATGDRQWIHVDPERARRESPFGGTVAHGYLTLCLAPTLLTEIFPVAGSRLVVNLGLERLRMRAPVPTGSRVRMRVALTHVRPLRGGAARATIHFSFEVEGEKRPACFGDALVAYYP